MEKDPAVGNKGGIALPIFKDLPSALPARGTVAFEGQAGGLAAFPKPSHHLNVPMKWDVVVP